MTEPESKPLARPAEPEPKASASGTLQDLLSNATREELFEAIGYGFLELARRDRYRRPGRPRREDITEALHLESEGVPRKEIYRRLGKTTHEGQHSLKEAMRARKYRQRRCDESPPSRQQTAQ
jgi:hypothetical protein